MSDDLRCSFSLHGERQAWPQPDVSATALLLLSGGTTGTPKLIPRRHADYSYNFSASAELCGISQQSVYLAVLPVAHNFPLACPGILGTLACGGKVVLTDSASCDEVMPLIAQERVTHVALVPALAQLWVQAREWEDSDLRRCASFSRRRPARPDAAEQLSPPLTVPCNRFSVWRKACSVLPGWTIRMPPFSTAGRPLSPLDEIRIVDQDENDVAPGETGQLLTRGPYTISLLPRPCPQRAGLYRARVLPHRRQCQAG
ncbi:MAG: AMP-binding protein [Escherichia coli]